MLITLPDSRVDIVLRRAGLDRDPGWLPWLGRSVEFQFDAASSELQNARGGD